MPTVSAAQALQELQSPLLKSVCTNLPGLDGILQDKKPPPGNDGVGIGGVARGHITEVYGPPGVGKTTFG